MVIIIDLSACQAHDAVFENRVSVIHSAAYVNPELYRIFSLDILTGLGYLEHLLYMIYVFLLHD